MNHLLDDDQDLMPRRERELTLSTGAILGIFFGLVLLCGFFFALGYNLHKPVQPTATATDTQDPAPADHGRFDHFNKPSAGLSAGAPAQLPSVSAANPTPAAPAPVTPAPVTQAPALSTLPPPSSATASAQPPLPSASATGAYVVQVAAVSHQEDADLLVGALRSKGYTVSAHSEPQDKLFHIQVGPFANRKDAESMRQRLLGDGYNAIVK